VITPQRFETFCGEWIKSGVQILGSCCGIELEHIRPLREALPKRLPVAG
jgi:S-methylmethionine-dependent homocysteine/selenocysteine methylase